MSFLLPHFFIKTVSDHKNKTALIIGDHEYSYQLIYEDCLRLVTRMKLSLIENEERVMIIAGNSYTTIIAFWATLLCEGVPCIIDQKKKNNIFKKIIEKLDPGIIIGENTTDSKFRIILDFKKDYLDGLCERVDIKYNLGEVKFKRTDQDLAMMMHTSGSTGEPKGVMLSHYNVISAIQSINTYLELNGNDIVFSVLPLHFDYGLYQMLLCFNLGATLILEKNFLFPTISANKIAYHKATILPCVPLIIQLFYLLAKRFSYDFSSLRLITNTGENLSKSHIEKLKFLFPGAKLFSMYGLTECKRCSYVPSEMLDKKSESIGIPMPNLGMWVQDKKGNKVEAGIEGELVVSGPTVMLGYWKDTEETEKKIQINSVGKRILLTGDRVIMDAEGYFYFKGRSDFIVKYKGAKLNVYDYVMKLSIISEITRSYLFLNDNKELIVCVELEDIKNKSDQLLLSIRSHFPEIQKPDYIYFTDHFSSLSNGKIDKNGLEKIAMREAREL
ncbi:MAG: class I adenylate-forming enzyme family protein [Gammaproteobacteria bacterium]|nr:class I adenylate-forming enzyme family protein [Gammaproteobacteria bacterium]